MLAENMQNRGRGAAEFLSDTPANFAFAAPAPLGQMPRAADDLLMLGSLNLRQIHRRAHLILMRCKESLDTGQKEADASPIVGEDKPARRQALAPPALNRFACDVKPLADILDRQ